MLLGIGGVRALRLWSRLTGAPAPDVYHTNEGHAGFLGIERIRELDQPRTGMTFDEALEAVRAATVFTTHTPVPAGIDRFGADQIQMYFGGDNALAGRAGGAAARSSAPRTTRAASRACSTWRSWACASAQRANGVSQLHGVVSRHMFDGLWPGFDDTEVPITSITNGVHAPTWVDRKVYELARQAPGHHRPRPRQRLGPDRRRPRRRDLGDQARAARAAGQGGPPPGALLVGQARREPAPSWAGSTTSSTPTS